MVVAPRPGSSPLARGTPSSSIYGASLIGLIPARAGNTRAIRHPRCPCRAHPRSRGEHTAAASIPCSGWGSSPLARGTPRPTPERVGFFGLIPARAGNTNQKHADGLTPRAHPRSRGEHTKNPPGSGWVWGSSPLARGTQRLAPGNSGVHGLIPARAGNTIFSARSYAPPGAHPRSRGEHTF